MNDSMEFRSSSQERRLERADNLAFPLGILTVLGSILGLPETTFGWKLVAVILLIWIVPEILSEFTLRRRRFGSRARLVDGRLFVMGAWAMEPVPFGQFLEVRIERSRNGSRRHFHFLHQRGRMYSLYSPSNGQELEDLVTRLGEQTGVPVRVRYHRLLMSNWTPLVTYAFVCVVGLAVGRFIFD